MQVQPHLRSAPAAKRPEPIPYAGFILLVRDTTGRVCIEYAENASLRLNQLMRGGVDVDSHRHEHSPHAREIVQTIRQQFADRMLESGANWFMLDWTQVTTALDDYKLDTGELAREGRLVIGSQVLVAGLDEVGEICHFRQEGKRRLARVAFARPVKTPNLTCIAAFFPTDQLRLLIRQPSTPEVA